MPTYSLGFCLWNLASEGFPNPEYLELTWHNLPLHHLEFDRLSSLPPSLACFVLTQWRMSRMWGSGMEYKAMFVAAWRLPGC